MCFACKVGYVLYCMLIHHILKPPHRHPFNTLILIILYSTSLKNIQNRGLQSKKLAHLEHQLSSNLKATQHRIWSGVTKDVGYLRRVLNELYILKVKVMPNSTMNIYIQYGQS